MARPLRIEYPGAWYHLMNHGRRGENVFADSDDYETFIALLLETSKMFDLRVSAFCLMSNHYHILVQTPSGNLSPRYDTLT
jgi:REP element-mobilizing transposase RayT